jgi:hypothetical protein
MNAHYDAPWPVGNSNGVRWLLGRAPTRFAEFVRRELPLGSENLVQAEREM